MPTAEGGAPSQGPVLPSLLKDQPRPHLGLAP